MMIMTSVKSGWTCVKTEWSNSALAFTSNQALDSQTILG